MNMYCIIIYTWREGVRVGRRGGKEEVGRRREEEGGGGRVRVKYTLSFRRALAPALRRDCVVFTSPLSAAKWRADHPVLCDDGG